MTETPAERGAPAVAKPLVSVCIVHKDRPELLRQALQSVFLQTYSNIEIILIDDDSILESSFQFLDQPAETFSRKGWLIKLQANSYLGRSRNVTAEHAEGDWLFFPDGDTVCHFDQVVRLVQAARSSGADIIVSMMDILEGNEFPGDPAQPALRLEKLVIAVAEGRLEETGSAIEQILLAEDRDYLMQDRDVAEAIARGEIPSAAHHYLNHGRVEGRRWALAETAMELRTIGEELE